MKNTPWPAALLVALSVLAIEPTASGYETEADLVQRWVAAAFPELTGSGVTYQWHFFPLVAEVFSAATHPPSPSSSAAAVLRVEVSYDSRRLVRSIGFDGEVVKEAENQRLREILAQHEHWNEHDVATWLAGDGAAFGPDREQQLRAAFSTRQFDGVLGPSNAVSFAFVWQMGHPEAGPGNIGIPGWRITLRPKVHNRIRCNILKLEPYAARLTFAVASPQPCRGPGE